MVLIMRWNEPGQQDWGMKDRRQRIRMKGQQQWEGLEWHGVSDSDLP